MKSRMNRDEEMQEHILNNWGKYHKFAKELCSQEINELVIMLAQDCNENCIDFRDLDLNEILKYLNEE